MACRLNSVQPADPGIVTQRLTRLVVHLDILKDEECLDRLDDLDGDVERDRHDVLEHDEARAASSASMACWHCPRPDSQEDDHRIEIDVV
jgi:hypothetical protein